MRSIITLSRILVLLAIAAPAAFAQRFAVQTGNWNGAIWASTTGGAPGSAAMPISSDDITINPNVTVTVNIGAAECKAVAFADSTSRLAMDPSSVLNVYGNFTLAAATHNAFTSWAPGAKIRFTGSSAQVLGGWSTSTTAVSTTLMEVVVDKSGDTLKTAGGDRKLNIGTSLDIVNGVFILASTDDIQGRNIDGTAATRPTITIQPTGRFIMQGGASHIGSGTTGVPRPPIGKLTILGYASLATTSTNRLGFGGVDIESGATLDIETFSTSTPGCLRPDTMRIKTGAIVSQNTTTRPWDSTATVILQTGAIYKITTATTNLPINFINNGTVRYQRTAGDGSQTIVDMNYFRLEVSFAGAKTWTLGGNRVVADSLEINNSTSFVITAAAAQTLTLNGTLRLTSGSLDNSNANAVLRLGDNIVISRARGTISDAPQFGTSATVRYTSTLASVTTGPELPTAASVLRDLQVVTDTTVVTLAANATVNGTLILSNGILNNSAAVLTLANNANIRRATGTLTQAPTLTGLVNVAYISTVSSVATGNELPTAANKLNVLSIQTPLNVSLNASVTVNGSLELLRGALFLGANNLTLSAAAGVTGVPADSAMVVTNGTGEFRRSVSASGSYLFPVGDSLGTDEYSPATINFTAGTFTNAVVGVKVVNAKHPNNSSPTHYLDRYWTVTQTGVSGFSAGVTFKYADADLHGTEASIYCGRWNGSGWNRLNAANVTTNELTGTVSAFSDFTGGDANAVNPVAESKNVVPAEFSLSQNYPNPFNPSTNVTFGIPVRSNATLEVFNLLGQKVETLLSEELVAGYHTVEWKPAVASGIYLYKVTAIASDGSGHQFSSVRKMVLTK